MSLKKRNNFIPLTTREKSKEKEKDIREDIFNLLIYLKQKIKTNKLFSNHSIQSQSIDNNHNNNQKSRVIINMIKDLINIIFSKIGSLPESNKTAIDEIPKLKNYIIKLETDIKIYIAKLFQYKIQKEAYQFKIQKYSEMKEEFDSLKEKVKYKNGKFLENDRKDNEIIILRNENSNLKSEIKKMEIKNKQIEVKIIEKEKKIENLNEKIKELESQIKFYFMKKNDNNLKTVDNFYNVDKKRKINNKYCSLSSNHIKMNMFYTQNSSFHNINNSINFNQSTTNNNHIINNSIIINNYNRKDTNNSKISIAKNKKNKVSHYRMDNISNYLSKENDRIKNSFFHIKNNTNKNNRNHDSNNVSIISLKSNKKKLKKYKNTSISMRIIKMKERNSVLNSYENKTFALLHKDKLNNFNSNTSRKKNAIGLKKGNKSNLDIKKLK